jgi:hypothetical protein
MTIIENDPNRISKVAETDASGASARVEAEAAAPDIDDPFNDPEVLRRVGKVISEAVRKPQKIGSR